MIAGSGRQLESSSVTLLGLGLTREQYFDYQSTTPVDPRVLDEMLPYFREDFGNPHSGENLFGRRAREAVELAREQIGQCVGSGANDIVFVSGATEANNLAVLGTSRGHSGIRDTILVSSIEHSSVLESASASGRRIVVIPVDVNGLLNIDALREALTDRVLLVSVGAVNNEIGTIQDLSTIGQLAQSAGALVHVDAAQALTAIRLRLTDLPVDFVSLSAHKAYGPKGIGALYIAPGCRRHLGRLFHGGGQERGLRPGTLPTALCVGFGAACEILKALDGEEFGTIAALRDEFLDQITRLVPRVELIGSITQRHPGNLSIRLPVKDARDVVERLHWRVACSTGSACHSGSELPSHVLSAVGMSTADCRRVIRLGLGRFSTSAACAQAAEAIAAAIDEVLVASGR
jgi:cysteine desulfurase